MLRMSVGAFDQQREPRAESDFPRSARLTHFAKSCFVNKRRSSESKEAGKLGSVERCCACLARIVWWLPLSSGPSAFPVGTVRSGSPAGHSPRFRSLLLAPVQCWLTSGGVLLLGLLLLGKPTHTDVVVVVEGIMNSGGGAGCILAPRSPQLGSSQVSGPQRKREGTYLSPVCIGA